MAPILPVKLLVVSSLILATYGAAIDTSIRANIPHCNTVVSKGEDTGLKGVKCYLEMSADGEETDDGIFQRSANTDSSKVTCANTRPVAADITFLCNNIPRSVTIDAAPNNTQAHCEVYMYKTAAWAVCNANHCASSTFTTQRAECHNISPTCKSKNLGGYVIYQTPHGLSSLYKQGTPDNPPIKATCTK